MNSSGMKRGLAASAVSALAITGVPFLAGPANATPVADQVGTGNVVLYSQFNTASTNDGSVRPDGTDSTVQLAAGGGPNVTSVTFTYQIGAAAPVTIATVASRNDDGLFAHDWDASGVQGAEVTLTATATLSGGGTVTDSQSGVTIQPTGSAVDSVALENAGAKGVFQQPYGVDGNQDLVVVRGTTSDTSDGNGTVTVTRRDGTNTAQNATEVPVADADGTGAGTTGSFQGAMDITGYPYNLTPGGTDELVLGAEFGTDDVEGYTLYKQTVADSGTTVVATPSTASVQGTDTQTVTITILDSNNQPIAGVEVIESGTTSPKKYTDSKGQVTFDAAEGTHTYYANNTESDPYEAGQGDKQSNTVTVSSFDPESTELVVTSADGSAFDFDENSAGDIVAQLKDQNGGDFEEAGRTIRYYWKVTPFDGDPATQQDPPDSGAGQESETVLTGADGSANIPFPTGLESGTYVLFASVENRALPGTGDGTGHDPGTGGIAEEQELSVKAGEADIVFAESEPEQAVAGGQEDVAGTLELEDGTGLPGRVIDVTLTDRTETGEGGDGAGDAVIIQDGADDDTHTVTTGAAGGFSVTVDDPAETPQPEETLNVNAATGATPNIGDAAAASSNEVNFISSVTPGDVALGATQALIDGIITPGRPATVVATVRNAPAATAGSDTLSNQDVQVSVTNGAFLTPGATSSDELTAAGGVGDPYGVWENLGSSTTVTTDGNGEVPITVAMGRNTDFDDDGVARTTLTVTAGGVTQTRVIEFISIDALNIASIEAVPTDTTADDLPDVQTRENAVYDVYARDQFGNLTKVDFDAEDDTAFADFDTNGGDCDKFGCSSAETQFLLDDPALVAFSDREVSQNITVTADDTTGEDNGADLQPGQPGLQPSSVNVANPQSDALATINWYVIDFENSTFTLDQDGPEVNPVNSGVTEILTALDQRNAPIRGLYVEFFRSGPSDQPGDDNDANFTNADGEATYNFTGTREGTATVNAVIYEDASRANQIDTASDTVKFSDEGRIAAALTLRGNDNGGRDDRLLANAHRKTEGARVKLFRKRKDGTWKLIDKARMNDRGNHKFRVNDRNGDNGTRYKAVVKRTDLTKRGVGKDRVQ